MPERRYTLQEIDQMREFFRAKLVAPGFPLQRWSCVPGGTSNQTEESIASFASWRAQAEDQLRTAMLAGIDPIECVPLKPL